MKISYQEYFQKVRGCFIGKSVGGTLGMPYEGDEFVHHLTYYDPVPTKMVANDDLDLQVMFLEAIYRFGLPVHRSYLAEMWQEVMNMDCDEYGAAKKNMRIGLCPPVTGYYDNKFYGGMGAAIRTELWACLAPGDPDLAVALAREDASIDHYSDGLEAAEFLAALESAAFVETDLDKLIETGLSYLNPEGRLFHALSDTAFWCREETNPEKIRAHVLERYYVQNWTDVSINLSFILVGLLLGRGDFGKSLCIAVNCGNDTDCTGATLGSLLGILNPDGITEEWIKPIGDELVLGGCMSAMHEVKTIREFCLQIAALCEKVQEFYHPAVTVTDFADLSEYGTEIASPWTDRADGLLLTADPDCRESVLSRYPVETTLIYPPKIALAAGETAAYTLRFRNLIAEKEISVDAGLHLPHGFSTGEQEKNVILCGRNPVEWTFAITAASDLKNSCFHPLQIRLTAADFRTELKAGIPTAVSWYRKPIERPCESCPKREEFAGADRFETCQHFFTVPAGRQLLSIECRTPAPARAVRLVAEGERALRVWLDGEEVLRTDGSFYVPAFHRGPQRGSISLSGNWQRVVIEVEDGKEGEIFFGFAAFTGYEWLYRTQYRLPALAEE